MMIIAVLEGMVEGDLVENEGEFCSKRTCYRN